MIDHSAQVKDAVFNLKLSDSLAFEVLAGATTFDAASHQIYSVLAEQNPKVDYSSITSAFESFVSVTKTMLSAGEYYFGTKH